MIEIYEIPNYEGGHLESTEQFLKEGTECCEGFGAAFDNGEYEYAKGYSDFHYYDGVILKADSWVSGEKQEAVIDCPFCEKKFDIDLGDE